MHRGHMNRSRDIKQNSTDKKIRTAKSRITARLRRRISWSVLSLLLLGMGIFIPAVRSSDPKQDPSATTLDQITLAVQFLSYVTEVPSCRAGLDVSTRNCVTLAKYIGTPHLQGLYAERFANHPEYDQFLHCSLSCTMTLSCDDRIAVPAIYTAKELKDLIDQFLPASVRERERGGRLRDGNAEIDDLLADFQGQMLGYGLSRFHRNQPEIHMFPWALDRCAHECKQQLYPMSDSLPDRD